MQRECFTSVAGGIVGLKSQTGIVLNYNQADAQVTVSSAKDFTNPEFKGTFKFAPGTVTLASAPAKGGNVAVSISPDLSKFGASLNVQPLTGQFTFNVKGKCPCQKADAALAYSSETQKVQLTVKTNGKTKTEIVAKSLKALPDVKTCTEMGPVTVRSFFQADKKQLRAAAFYQLPQYNAAIGVASCFEAVAKPAELFVMGKATVKGLTASAVTTVLKESKVAPAVELRAEYAGKCEKGSFNLGASAEFVKGGAMKFVQGGQFSCSCGSKLAYTVNNEKKMIVKFSPPACATGDFSVTATFDKLELNKAALTPALGFSMTLKQ